MKHVIKHNINQSFGFVFLSLHISVLKYVHRKTPHRAIVTVASRLIYPNREILSTSDYSRPRPPTGAYGTKRGGWALSRGGSPGRLSRACRAAVRQALGV